MPTTESKLHKKEEENMLGYGKLTSVLLVEFLLLVTVLVTSGWSFLGDPCEHNYQCTKFYNESKCHSDGYCTCTYPELLYYTIMSLDAKCDFVALGQAQRGKRCPSEPCGENAYCTNNGLCNCHSGLVRISDDCVKGSARKLFESCEDDGYSQYKDKSVAYCDVKVLGRCVDGTCLCHRDYYYNYNTRRCERKSSYNKNYGKGFSLDSEYKGKFEMYCTHDWECVDGLDCHNYKCSCSPECEFVKSSQSCDCMWSISTILILLMVLLGVVIIAAFLYWKFILQKKTGTVTRLPDPTSNTASFPLTPDLSSPPNPSTFSHTLLPNHSPASSRAPSPIRAPSPYRRSPSPYQAPSPSAPPPSALPPTAPSFSSSNPHDLPPPYSSLYPADPVQSHGMNPDYSYSPAHNPSYSPNLTSTNPSNPTQTHCPVNPSVPMFPASTPFMSTHREPADTTQGS